MTLTFVRERPPNPFYVVDDDTTYSEAPIPAAPLDSPVRGSTGSDVFGLSDETVDSVEERVRAIKEESGLTWKQLGRLFGVSMRAVQGWAVDGRLSSKNLERLMRLEEIIGRYSAGTPDETRLRLMSVVPGHNESPFSQMLADLVADRPEDPQRSWASRI